MKPIRNFLKLCCIILLLNSSCVNRPLLLQPYLLPNRMPSNVNHGELIVFPFDYLAPEDDLKKYTFVNEPNKIFNDFLLNNFRVNGSFSSVNTLKDDKCNYILKGAILSFKTEILYFSSHVTVKLKTSFEFIDALNHKALLTDTLETKLACIDNYMGDNKFNPQEEGFTIFVPARNIENLNLNNSCEDCMSEAIRKNVSEITDKCLNALEK